MGFNFRELFSKKSRAPSFDDERVAPSARGHEELHLDALDDCVGGRVESHDVGCYLQSTPSQAH
jgi:hypothetical protein